MLARGQNPLFELGAHLLQVETRQELPGVEFARLHAIRGGQSAKQVDRVAVDLRGDGGAGAGCGDLMEHARGGHTELRESDPKAVERALGVGPEQLRQMVALLGPLDRQVRQQQQRLRSPQWFVLGRDRQLEPAEGLQVHGPSIGTPSVRNA